MINLSQLKPKPGSKKAPKRVGRGPGSGLGKTCGRGHKGQSSRAGRRKHHLSFEGGQMPLSRRVPKRGFTNIFRTEYAEVNVFQLNRFEPGSVVGEEELRASGLVKKKLPIKILGKGELTRPLVVRAHKFSAQAKNKIESAGGKAEVIQ